MNRLIIIGNGFDLAHSLPTSYSSFINFIWRNFHNLDKIPMIKNLFTLENPMFDIYTGLKMQFNDYNDFCNQVKNKFNTANYTYRETFHGSKSFQIIEINPYDPDDTTYQVYFDYKNQFFELITVQNADNWVDIENTYYQVLISMLKGESKYKYIGNIKKLNNEFEEIRKLLEFYLTGAVQNFYDFENQPSNYSEIVNLFEYKYKALHEIDNIDNPYFFEFPPDCRKKLIEFDSLFSVKSQKSSILYENLFLNFNYTPTIFSYLSILNNMPSLRYGISTQLQIHGKLGDENNSINFGFGDEMDDNYKILEKANDNNYLENIKSFMYLNNSNYKKLLNWIESNEYQVFIMGHSCGLSDRTLLNTVFEHNNCKSIKIFYHKKENGQDNFKDLSQNISRHFNKKALMRSKVVDKSNSIPLPQNIRFNKIDPSPN
ncbi:hypothetical protein QE422_001007 [Chryseobacterium sp. SORGH_AS 447]|uniref:AbiH family protein n=1 Tax=Chryseobacterium sp. SORGH_AS_0447 TaxID=3041769 RepID=UPI0027800CB1|nr:AbiH family protein [Chryseobacterium sp. SORGH_AS_0447]MDQ1160639.1 hypothetical protein [Chryseobacterium sp. SORGH_AS_0447]